MYAPQSICTEEEQLGLLGTEPLGLSSKSTMAVNKGFEQFFVNVEVVGHAENVTCRVVVIPTFTAVSHQSCTETPLIEVIGVGVPEQAWSLLEVGVYRVARMAI